MNKASDLVLAHAKEFLQDLRDGGGSRLGSAGSKAWERDKANARQWCRRRGYARSTGLAFLGDWAITDAGRAALERAGKGQIS